MASKGPVDVDVIVVGYGLAGAVAAIAAHDQGAKVLLVEKAKYPGGCSILSGGGIKCVKDVDRAVEYFSAISGGRMEHDMIVTFAEGLAGNEAYLRRLAELNGARVGTSEERTGGAFPSQGVYPFSGREGLYSVWVLSIPGFTGYPWVVSSRRTGANIMKLVFDNVEARGIATMLETKVERLLTDESGAAVGVALEQAGGRLEVRARRGVVLATGGFEQSPWLHEQYLQGKPFYSMAPLTHTGDGILMAQKAGAALWHMWLLHGSYGFKFPEFPIAFRNGFGGFRDDKKKMPWIVVDKFGRRYMNEYPRALQDTAYRAMELYDPDMLGYARIPSYMIFDEVGRQRGPIAKPIAFEGSLYKWSHNNGEEVAKGWIWRADSLGELAELIGSQPNDEGRMTASVLEGEVAAWNDQVAQGVDRYNRPPGTMMPIGSPPFYAAEVWPVITNTQGGPVHNARQQVMDPYGQPIPRLYSVGELGSFFGHLYEIEGNLGECVSSGRIAGENVAREEPL